MIKNLFKKNKSLVGNFYVVQGGIYGGDYLVLIKETATELTFLVLPDKQKRTISIEDFNRGLKNKIVKLIERLPNYVFEECKKEYDIINKDIWTLSDQYKLQAQSADNLYSQK
jgi:hypothetical protein